MTTRPWIRRLFASQPPTPARRRSARCRLSLEALEDRTLLDSYTAATVADLVRDIGLANQAGGTSTITLSAAAGSTYTLYGPDNTTDGANGLPVIRPGTDLTIVGNGDTLQRSPTTGAAFRLFDVASGAKLTLQNLTLQNGWAFGSGVSAQGGAIYSQGFLTLNGVTVRNNTAQDLTLNWNGYKLGGDAFGGGLYVGGVAGTATLTDVTLSGNLARGGDNHRRGKGGDAFGGGLYVGNNAWAFLTDVTLSGNLARGGAGADGFIGGDGDNGGNAYGGGLYVAGGPAPTAAFAFLQDVTLSGNSARGGAGGIGGEAEYTAGKGGAGGDAAGGGVAAAGGTVWLVNTLIAQNTPTAGAGGLGGYVRFSGGRTSSGSSGNTGGPDVFGSVSYSDHNLVGDGTGSNLSAGVNGNQVGTSASPINPLLGPLQDNGGPTPTMALLRNSPAIDAGNSLASGLPSTDQRGFARVSGATVDIGAYEVQVPSLDTATLPNATYGTAYRQTLTATEGGYSGSFTFAVTGSLTLGFPGSPPVTIGALPPGLSLASDGTLSGTPTAPGSFSFTVTATDSGGLTASRTYTLAIDLATLTITPAAGQSKVYGAAVPALAYTVSGFVNGDPATTLRGALGTTATTASPVGSYGFTLGSLSAGLNYTVVLAANSPTFAVTPATLTVTPAAGQSKVYGAAVPTLTYTASGLANGDSASTLTGALGTTATAASPVGSYAFTPGTLAAGPNYTLALAAAPPTFAVTPATLTVTADNAARLYGAANPAFTPGYSGFVLGQALATSGVTGSPGLSTTATAASAPGSYAITAGLGTLAAANYTFAFVNGTLTISPAPLSATAVSVSATAGAPFSGPVATFTNADPSGGAASYSAVITWGDGSTSAGVISGTGSTLTVSGAHTYAAAGSDAVSVEITHDLGYTTTATTSGTATVTSLGLGVQKSLTGTTHFWEHTGQALIQSFNGGSTATALSGWLAATFPNLYGSAAGANDLAGKTNAQVAAFYLSQFALAGTKAEAQVLATALSVYATTTSLGGPAGQAYGFSVSDAGLGARSYSVGKDGAAVGVANDTVLDVYQLLQAVNQTAVNGVPYNGDAALREAAALFGSLNQAGSVG